MQTTLHACTLPIKPINAHAIPSNQAYHKSCKRQWLIRQKATYITYLCHEQTSISLKSGTRLPSISLKGGTRLPWKDTRDDLLRTYHYPSEKLETHSMSSHAYKRREGKRKKEGKNTTIRDHHRRLPQSHRKHYPKPLETITRSLQDHHHKTTSSSP